MLYLLYREQRIIEEENKCQIEELARKLAQWLKTNLYANITKLLNNIISTKEFVNRHKLEESAFTRERLLPFKLVILFIINLLKSSIQNELDKFYKIINGDELPERQITNSAFCQARKKLSHKAFEELNKEQTKYFYNNVNYHRWNSFRLIAIDGSTLIVPKNEETIREFGEFTHSPKKSTVVIARVSQSYDVLNKITLDSCISPLSEGELDLAARHIKSSSENKNDLYLFDRGYNAFWLFNMILTEGSNFCVRIKVGNWKAAQELIDSSQREMITEIKPSKTTTIRKCKKLGISIEPMTVRFISIDLDNGDKEVLITSLLDIEKYPYELFKDLYQNRWPIEERYKIMKSRIEVENFSGKSTEAIKQDFYALVFTQNLTAILAFPVHEKIIVDNKNKKYDYQINWTQAIAKMKDTIVLLFTRDNIDKVINKLQEHFLNNIQSIRPNRKFPRIPRPKRHYYMAYKSIS